MKIKRSRKNTILILAAVVLIGAVVAIAIGYSGEISGTIVDIRQDSPLPLPTEPPTDTPEPATSTPSPTPIAIYRVRIGVTWYDASGNPLSEPPAGLPADFRITANSEIGQAVCAYSPGSSDLICQYSTLADSTGGSDDLLVPSGTAYTVGQSGIPAQWRTFAGVGLFYSAGSSPTYIHTVSNRTSRAPTATPVPPTNTPPSAPAQPETPTPTPPIAPPPPDTPTSSSTPLPATATPPPPTSTPTDVSPTSTPTVTPVPPTSTPTDVPPTATPTDIPPTSTPTDIPPTPTPTDVPPTSTPEPTATPTEAAPTQESSASPTHTPSPTPAKAAQAAPELSPTLEPETVPETSSRFLSSTLCLCMGSAAIVVAGFIVVLLVRDRRKQS